MAINPGTQLAPIRSPGRTKIFFSSALAVPTMTRDVAVDFAYGSDLAPEIVELVSFAEAEICNPRRLKRYVNWLSMTLQQIVSSDLPEGIDNLFALHSLTLRKHYPGTYDAMLQLPRKSLGRDFNFRLDCHALIKFHLNLPG
jgi:hypothetical protein